MLASEQRLLITVPSSYAPDYLSETKATFPLVDPRDNKHIGQSVVDFRLEKAFATIAKETDAHFAAVITPARGAHEGNDVVLFGASTQPEEGAASFIQLALPFDTELSENYKIFKNVTDDMKQGKQGEAEFWRKNESGPDELIHLHYAPVFVRSLAPVRGDDFRRGVNVSYDLVYSIAVAQRDDVLRAPYRETEQTLHEKTKIIEIVFLAVVFLLTIVCGPLTAQVS